MKSLLRSDRVTVCLVASLIKHYGSSRGIDSF